MQTVPNWMSAGLVFVFILAVHVFIGTGQAKTPEKYSGWIDKVGLSFDAAVIKSAPPMLRTPASVETDIYRSAQF